MLAFIDTNILVYAEADDEPFKKQQSLEVLQSLYLSGTGVISTQVLSEYCNVALRKLRRSHAHVSSQLNFFEQFLVVQVTPALIKDALGLLKKKHLSFYDSLIVTSAQAAGCDVLLSEDMNGGERIGSLVIQNPYA